MPDALPLMLVHAAQATLIAAAAALALRGVSAGSAAQRLTLAVWAFYAAALLPLAMLLPHRLVVVMGPERTPLLDVTAWAAPRFDAPIWSVLVLLVAAIAVARLARTALAAWRSERLAQRATPLAPEALGLPAHARVSTSPDVDGPMVAGVRTPVIILPERMRDALTPEVVLLCRHEYAHVQRNDLRRALLQRCVEDLLWWNPGVLWLGRIVAEQREMACDAWAAQGADDAYALALIGEARARASAQPALAMMLRGSSLERRLRRLTKGARRTLLHMIVLVALVFAASALLTPRADRDGATYVGIDTA